MKEKKERILKNCRDFIYEKVFNNTYNAVNRIYTKDKIQKDIDKYLENLITRGELFYGSNFTDDFVKEKTDDARDYLVNDLFSYDYEEKSTMKQKKYEVPVKKETYEDVVEELINCGLSEEKANEFIKNNVKDRQILQGALDYFNKDVPKKDDSGIDKNATIYKQTPSGDGKIPVKTQDASKSLLEKFKAKWETPSFRKRVIITAGVLTIGVVAALVSPELQSFIAHFLPADNMNVDNANLIVNNMQGVDTNTITDAVTKLDTSSWNMEGINIADNAKDAVLGNTDLNANEWFSNRLQGLYDTSTGKMIDASQTDLQNTDFVKTMLQNDNIAAVFGDGKIGTLNNVDGFVNGDTVENLINARSR